LKDEITLLVASWEKLPEAVRAGILAMIEVLLHPPAPS
jgi:hypothetical protein